MVAKKAKRIVFGLSMSPIHYGALEALMKDLQGMGVGSVVHRSTVIEFLIEQVCADRYPPLQKLIKLRNRLKIIRSRRMKKIHKNKQPLIKEE